MYHVTEKLYIVSWIVEIPISFLKNHGISTSDIEKGGGRVVLGISENGELKLQKPLFTIINIIWSL